MKNEESEEELKKLLDLYLKGRLSASQKAQAEKQLDTFRKEDPTEYEFNQQQSDHLWKKIANETIGKKSGNGRLWISVAAAVVLTSAAVLLMLSWNHDGGSLSNKVILQDGTIVWLKENASLNYSELTTDHREVSLMGEALFEVARNPQHPFIIHCGNFDATVTGTSFNLKSDENSIELTVLTGTVRLSSKTKDSSVLVKSNEFVVFSENSDIIKTNADPSYIQGVTENTQYDMHFEDTRMREVVTRVETKFNVNIELENEDIANCMISADFTDQSLPLTLAMISEALGFQYEINGNDVVISGTGCNE